MIYEKWAETEGFFGFEVTWDLLQQITYKQVDLFLA